jgi:hypothetical protein
MRKDAARTIQIWRQCHQPKQESIATEGLELVFEALELEGLDQAAFKRELLQGFADLGLPQEDLAKIVVSFRADVAIVSVREPSDLLSRLWALPLDSLSIMGCCATPPAGWFFVANPQMEQPNQVNEE